MNVSVTVRRLLGALAVCAAVASNALAYSLGDDFESYADDASVQTFVAPWVVDAADVSWVDITNYTYTATTYPISGTHSKVLNLDTKGKQLKRTIDNSQAIGVVYVDTMVSLVPSDPAPTVSDTAIQTAVYLDASGYLNVLTGKLDAAGAAFIAYTGMTLTPNEWYRLTITMDYDSGDDDLLFVDRAFFKVAVNGTTLTSDQAYAAPFNGADPGTVAAGTWFLAANATTSDPEAVNSVEVQGTGAIDDFLVTTTAPNYGGETPFSLWLAANGIDESYDDGDVYNLNQEFIAGLDPTVNELYEITSFSIDGLGILTLTYNGADSSGNQTVVLESATAGGATTVVPGTLTFSGGVWTFVSDAAVTGEFFSLYATDVP